MKPTRIVLLAVALVAGGLAAYLATRGAGTPQQVAQIVSVDAPQTQILVANQAIGVGQRLTPETVEWQSWPESAVRPEYVTISAVPDAPTQLTGTLARFEIFPGEPIREAKLVRADEGYLSAVLQKGMRAVSLPVNAESSAGGFIVPNDRVDIVQTITTDQGLKSQTILQNVKVLAIGQRLGERGLTAGSPDQQKPESQVFQAQTIATVELDPTQAEAMVTAVGMGRLSLVLRSMRDFNQPVELLASKTDSQTVKLIRFGVETSVLPASASAPAVVDKTALASGSNDFPGGAPAPIFTPATGQLTPLAPVASGVAGKLSPKP